MICIENLKPESKTETSVSVLSMAASRTAAHSTPPNEITAFRDALTSSLTSFADEDSQIDQGKFWRLYKELNVETLDLADLAKAIQVDFSWKFELPDVANLDILQTADLEKLASNFFPVRPDRHIEVVDCIAECKSFLLDQNLFPDWSLSLDRSQRFFLGSFHEISHEISHKAARRAIRATIAEINLDDARSIDEFVRLIGSTLAEKIFRSVRLVIRARSATTSRAYDDDTRHRILTFSIHTGNSPPSAPSRSRSIVGRALVTLNTNARSSFSETLQPRHRSRNLRNSLYRGHSRPRNDRRSRNHAHLDCRAQPSRRGGSWVHRPLAQCA
jgi:hypothetical protein